jgi:hypothetical protein
MGRYEEIDLRAVKSTSIRERPSKVHGEMLAHPPARPDDFAEFWDGLPDALAAAELRALARAVVAARRDSRPVVWMLGAHVIKVGLAPVLTRLLQEDLATLVAVNGAFAIHDGEMALWGKTSEDVEVQLQKGRFGMARETAALLNDTAREGAEREEGFGEALGRVLLARRREWVGDSVMGIAYGVGVPVTVHVAIGTDVVHQHSDFSGRAVGETSARDFRILAAHMRDLRGAVVINVGSAVILPEVFLKAFSVVTHLGGSSEGLVTATLDFNRHYRPLTNVVRRPQGGGRRGFFLVGHHEILMPLLLQGILLEHSREPAGRERNSGRD